MFEFLGLILILGTIGLLVSVPVMAFTAFKRTEKIEELLRRIEKLEFEHRTTRKRLEESKQQDISAAKNQTKTPAQPVTKTEPAALPKEDIPDKELSLESKPTSAETERDGEFDCPHCGLKLVKTRNSCPACGWDRKSLVASGLLDEQPEIKGPDDEEEKFWEEDLSGEYREKAKKSEMTLAATSGPKMQEQEEFKEPPDSRQNWTPSPTFSERLQQFLKNEELEAIVGSSWLNKIGVLVLIIGIALFIGYSLTQLGAAGRIAVGYVVSVVLMVIGFVNEKKLKYRVFSRGLLGGGWAGLYFTTFATHGIAASRIIESPFLATSLLIVVAAGMIIHSLFYLSQEITTLAYAFAFLAIAISPITSFSSVASIPLVLTLAIVAYHWSWSRMSIAGVVLAYGVWLLRYSVGANEATLWFNQVILFGYWLTFESLDIVLLLQRKNQDPDKARSRQQALFPLNVIGLLGASALLWMSVDPENLFLPMASCGVGFLISALIRAKFFPSSDTRDEKARLPDLLGGGYELSLALSSGLFVLAIYQRFTGLQVNVALLIEFAALFVIGFSLRQKFLQVLAYIVLSIELVDLLPEMTTRGTIFIFGTEIFSWTPLVLLNFVILLTCRLLVGEKPSQRGVGVEPFGAVLGNVLLVVVGALELPGEIFGISSLFFALAIFEIGFRRQLLDLLGQGYAISLFGVGWMLVRNGFQVGVAEEYAGELRWWIWLFPGMILSYAYAIRFSSFLNSTELKVDVNRLYRVCVATGTAFYSLLIWYVLPVPLVSAGWAAGGIVLIQLGEKQLTSWLRLNGHLLILASISWLFFGNLTNPGDTLGVSHRLLTVGPIILLVYSLAIHLRQYKFMRRHRIWESRMSGLYLWLGALLLILLMRFELGRVLAVFGWGLLMVVLVGIGTRKDLRDLRWQSYLIAVLVFVRSWSTNFIMPASLAGLFGRLSTGAVVIASFILAQFISRQDRVIFRYDGRRGLSRLLAHFDVNARWLFCLLATALLAVLLSFELTGRLETVAWGVEVLLLLAIGFFFRELPFFYWGLVLAFGTAVRLFIDEIPMRELGDSYRATAFITVISSFFAAHFLAPRISAAVVGNPSLFVKKTINLFQVNSSWIYCVIGTSLLTYLITREISGRLLTVGWGIEGTVLLILGFVLRDRTFRIIGLLILTVCVLKLFVLDLRGLDTPYRIGSFVLLGVLMIVVSWIYTKYRDQIKKQF